MSYVKEIREVTDQAGRVAECPLLDLPEGVPQPHVGGERGLVRRGLGLVHQEERLPARDVGQPLEAEADVGDGGLEDGHREDLEVVLVGEVGHLLLLAEAEAGDAAPADHDQHAAVRGPRHLLLDNSV